MLKQLLLSCRSKFAAKSLKGNFDLQPNTRPAEHMTVTIQLFVNICDGKFEVVSWLFFIHVYLCQFIELDCSGPIKQTET